MANKSTNKAGGTKGAKRRSTSDDPRRSGAAAGRVPARRGIGDGPSARPASGRSLWFAPLAFAVVGLAWLGARELSEYARRSPTFALREIEVVGARRVPEARIRERLGVGEGVNVFALDPVALEGRVQTLDWVRRVEVVRRWPDALRVRVEEHVPVAVAALGGLYHVDRQGEVFRALPPGETTRLPVVLGVGREAWLGGDPVARARLRAALDFLTAWRRAWSSNRAGPASVEVSAGGLVRFTTRDGIEVSVGPAPWDAALEDVKAGLSRARADGLAVRALTVGRGRRAGRVSLLSKTGEPGGEP